MRDIAAIYTILGMTEFGVSEDGYPNTGRTKLMGYYANLMTAEEAITENAEQLRDNQYNFIVVEQIREGLYDPTGVRWFYQWNPKTKTYEPILEPKWIKPFPGLTMG